MEHKTRKLFACQRGQYVQLDKMGVTYRVMNPADGMFARLKRVGEPPANETIVPAWTEVFV